MTKSNSHSLDDLEYVLCDAAWLWRKVLNQKAKELNITAHERRVLFVIKRHPGLTQVQVARYVDLKPQNLMRILDRLEQLGWIEKISAKEDRRSKLLYVTDQAKTIITQINHMGREIKNLAFAGFSEKHLKNLHDSLSKIKNCLLEQLSAS